MCHLKCLSPLASMCQLKCLSPYGVHVSTCISLLAPLISHLNVWVPVASMCHLKCFFGFVRLICCAAISFCLTSLHLASFGFVKLRCCERVSERVSEWVSESVSEWVPIASMWHLKRFFGFVKLRCCVDWVCFCRLHEVKVQAGPQGPNFNKKT